MNQQKQLFFSDMNSTRVGGLFMLVGYSEYGSDINPISGLLTDEGGQKGPLPEICHTYPTMMKLGTVIPHLKKIQKFINHVTHPLSSADITIFTGNQQLLLYQEIQI